MTETTTAAGGSAPPVRPIFATPSLDHTVTLEYLASWTQTVWALAAAGIGHGVIVRGGDCFVAKVRNKMASEFLAKHPDATHLFWIDSDVGWPADKVIEFLRRPEDMIAGIYPKKSEQLDFPVELAVADGGLVERDGLVLANSVPMGFTVMRRRVLERMAEGAEFFIDSEMDGARSLAAALFETGRGPDGWYWGEDYSFCRKWAGIGGQIWVDPSIPFTHRGTRKWAATLADSMSIFRERAAMAAQIQAGATP